MFVSFAVGHDSILSALEDALEEQGLATPRNISLYFWPTSRSDGVRRLRKKIEQVLMAVAREGSIELADDPAELRFTVLLHEIRVHYLRIVALAEPGSSASPPRGLVDIVEFAVGQRLAVSVCSEPIHSRNRLPNVEVAGLDLIPPFYRVDAPFCFATVYSYKRKNYTGKCGETSDEQEQSRIVSSASAGAEFHDLQVFNLGVEPKPGWDPRTVGDAVSARLAEIVEPLRCAGSADGPTVPLEGNSRRRIVNQWRKLFPGLGQRGSARLTFSTSVTAVHQAHISLKGDDELTLDFLSTYGNSVIWYQPLLVAAPEEMASHRILYLCESFGFSWEQFSDEAFGRFSRTLEILPESFDRVAGELFRDIR